MLNEVSTCMKIREWVLINTTAGGTLTCIPVMVHDRERLFLSLRALEREKESRAQSWDTFFIVALIAIAMQNRGKPLQTVLL